MSGPSSRQPGRPKKDPYRGFRSLQELSKHADDVWATLSPEVRQKRLERVTQGIEEWYALLRKYNAPGKNGAYGLERRMRRMESYRQYQQRWPFDQRASVSSLDSLSEEGIELPTESLDNAEEYLAVELVEAFMKELTPKQVLLLQKLLEGFTPKEFFADPGFEYKNTGGLRWHRHIMRKKFIDFRREWEAQAERSASPEPEPSDEP
jgi:hypothetical protein